MERKISMRNISVVLAGGRPNGNAEKLANEFGKNIYRLIK